MAGSWALEDLLLFEPQVYWRLFALENESVWPAQPVVLAAVALLALCFIRGGGLPAGGSARVLGRPGCGPAGSSSRCATARSTGSRQRLPGGSMPRPPCWRRSASRAGSSSCGGAAAPGLASPCWRRRCWHGPPLRRSTDGPGTRRRSSRLRRIPRPLQRSACWRSRSAAGGRLSCASRRRCGLRPPRSRSSPWVPGRAGRCLQPCSPASPPGPRPGQELQAARERRAAPVKLRSNRIRPPLPSPLRLR